MPDLTFNTTAGVTVARELLIAYLNTGTFATPVWSPIGKHVEDSSEGVDWGEETKNNILGNVYTTHKKPTITQSFEPNELDSGDAAIVAIWNKAIKDQDYSGLAAMDLLIVHFYAGSAAAPFAERYPESSVRPSELGGAGGGSVGMPFDVTYGGERSVGTVSKNASTGAITFTASSPSTLPKLSAFSITNASFVFDANTNSYTAEASASTGTVTATAATSGSSIVILVNGSSIASGGTATWAEGDNLVSVTVTYGGVSNTYEAHVSYSS